jgi:hydrogenase maturation protein HypF
MTIAHLKRILEIAPEIMAYDLHPDYLSSSFAEEQENIQKIQVQHHHAHIVSCMAEHKLDEPVIGLAFDGTGYGSDGKIWGGEILVAETHTFERAAHLAYVPMPGGATAIKEPWRMAISYLHDAFGPDFSHRTIPQLDKLDPQKVKIIGEMITKGVNSPMTSSLGRLFDGVAALTGVRNQVNFEGQAAMEFEMLAAESTDSLYDYAWKSGPVRQILPAPIISGIVADIQNKLALPVISAKFHATLIRLFSDLCNALRKERGVNRVVLSGGVFQNSCLLTGLIQVLAKNGFSVFTHQQVPANDGGISLGQAVVAAAKLRQ